MAKRPKPPSIEPPKIVPGKETARSIGIDTAFIDGLAAGLVDEADLPPPPVKAPAPAKAPAKKPPPPKGLSERSAPLFRVQEPEKTEKADEDPLAALLEDLPAEPTSTSGGTFVAPTRKDDLLAKLAAKDDDDGAVSLAPPPPPKKGASESSGAARLAKGGRSETSGNMPLPKGTDAPVFDPLTKGDAAKKKSEAAASASSEAAAEVAKKDDGGAAKSEPEAKAPPKPAAAPKKDAGSAAAAKPRVAQEPPALAGAGGALENVHPGLWLLVAAALFGLVVPWIAGGGTDGHTPTKTDAARHVPAKKTGASAAAPAVVGEAEREEEPESEEAVEVDEPEEAVDAEEAVEEPPEEELVEIEEEAAGGDGSSGKGKRKPDDGGGKEPKSATQLLNEAKTAYSQGRNGDAYRLAGQSHRQRASEDALTVRAKAACRMGNEAAAKKAFEDLPMGAARREVRPICRDKGIRLGI